MKNSKLTASAIALIALLCGCTDGQRGKIGAFGNSAHVRCYSGDILIYEGDSSGKISNSSQSDGYFFVDKADGKLKEVSGNCVIEYHQ